MNPNPYAPRKPIDYSYTLRKTPTEYTFVDGVDSFNRLSERAKIVKLMRDMDCTECEKRRLISYYVNTYAFQEEAYHSYQTPTVIEFERWMHLQIKQRELKIEG